MVKTPLEVVRFGGINANHTRELGSPSGGENFITQNGSLKSRPGSSELSGPASCTKIESLHAGAHANNAHLLLGEGANLRLRPGISGDWVTLKSDLISRILHSCRWQQFIVMGNGEQMLALDTSVLTNGILTSPAGAVGSTAANVANAAFDFYITSAKYTKAADAVGTAPGNDVVPQGKYGAVRFDIGADGTFDVVEATGNATGYDTAALAEAGLPAVADAHERVITVTATKSDSAFTFGTTALNAANTTVVITSHFCLADLGGSPPDMSRFAEWNFRIFGWDPESENPHLLWYCGYDDNLDISKDVWPADYNLNVGGSSSTPVLDVIPYGSHSFALTTRGYKRIYGADETNFEIMDGESIGGYGTDLSGKAGNAILWVGSDKKIYLYSGTQGVWISQPIDELLADENFAKAFSKVFGNQFWLIFTDLPLEVLDNCDNSALWGSSDIRLTVSQETTDKKTGTGAIKATFSDIIDDFDDYTLWPSADIPISSDNILTGGTAGATSDDGTHHASGASDGNTSTLWRTTSSLPQSWVYDLGAGITKTVEKFRFYGNGSDGPKNFGLYGSNDGTNFTPLLTVEGASNSSGWQEWTFTNTTAYRYYAIYVTVSWGGSATSIAEVEMMETGNEGGHFVVSQETTDKQQGTGAVKIVASTGFPITHYHIDRDFGADGIKDLSSINKIEFKVKTSIAINLRFGLGEAAATELVGGGTTIAGTWETISADISAIPAGSKDAIRYLRFSLMSEISQDVTILIDAVQHGSVPAGHYIERDFGVGSELDLSVYDDLVKWLKSSATGDYTVSFGESAGDEQSYQISLAAGVWTQITWPISAIADADRNLVRYMRITSDTEQTEGDYLLVDDINTGAAATGESRAYVYDVTEGQWYLYVFAYAITAAAVFSQFMKEDTLYLGGKTALANAGTLIKLDDTVSTDLGAAFTTEFVIGPVQFEARGLKMKSLHLIADPKRNFDLDVYGTSDQTAEKYLTNTAAIPFAVGNQVSKKIRLKRIRGQNVALRVTTTDNIDELQGIMPVLAPKGIK